MSAHAAQLDSDNPNIEMGRALCCVGKEIMNFLTDNPERSKNVDTGFLQVYAEVLSAVGLLFKNDDLGNTLKQILDQLKSYSTLLSYFLITRSIFDVVERVKSIDSKEHKYRLERINKELTRISVETTAIAQKLEVLGKSFIDIMRSDVSENPKQLQIFDFTYNEASLELESCMSGLERVKITIDEGLSSIKESKQKIASMTEDTLFGILISAVLKRIKDLLRSIFNSTNEADEIKECYNDQNFIWETLNQKLNTMKKHLHDNWEARKQLNKNT